MGVLSLNRSAFSIGAAAALLAGCGASQLPAATSPSGAARFAFTHHMTFRYTGKKQTFKVPSGVTRIEVIAIGASGGGKVVAHGGRVSAVIPVAQLETLAIYVGGRGTSSGGGFNGGGAGGPTGYGYNGYGGGGATDVREGGDALKDRVVVAGGGGGPGFPRSRDRRRCCAHSSRGGQGGARTGGSGKAGCCKHFGNGGGFGTGGTRDQGGSGGIGAYKNPGESGQLGRGGAGGSGCTPTCHGYLGGGGGGGGGGYFGGGGGGGGVFFGSSGAGGGGGGGGGSSYVERTASDIHLWQGWKQDQFGLVVFDW